MHEARCHGDTHYYFDATFGNDPRPVSEAVQIAKD